MLVSDGDFGIFLDRPLVLAIGLVILAVAAASVLDLFRKRQKKLRQLADNPDHTIYIG